MKKGRLQEIIKELQGASEMHLKQSKQLSKFADDLPSPANQNMVTGENTDKIQTDDKGEYSLVMDETQEGLKTGDTIRPANNKFFKPAVIGKSQGSKDGYLIGGDYNVQKTGDKNFQIKED